MESEEYTNLARVERDHWYYAGKRDVVRRWIARVRPPTRDDTLLDCGAGTGRFAAEMELSCRVLVLDDHDEALRLLRQRFRADQVLSLTDGRIPLAPSSVEYVTGLDVLEHVADDAAAVRGFHRVLKPGGLCVVTVPAGMALWSDWDVTLHHHRRYRAAELRRLFPTADWELVHVNHTNVVLYPIIWVVRRWRRWFPAAADARRAEDRIPPRWINGILRWVFVAPALSRIAFPVGVSLLLVARRR